MPAGGGGAPPRLGAECRGLHRSGQGRSGTGAGPCREWRSTAGFCRSDPGTRRTHAAAEHRLCVQRSAGLPLPGGSKPRSPGGLRRQQGQRRGGGGRAFWGQWPRCGAAHQLGDGSDGQKLCAHDAATASRERAIGGGGRSGGLPEQHVEPGDGVLGGDHQQPR